MSKLLIYLEQQISAHLYCSTNLEKATPPQIKRFIVVEQQDAMNTRKIQIQKLHLEPLKSFKFLTALS